MNEVRASCPWSGCRYGNSKTVIECLVTVIVADQRTFIRLYVAFGGKGTLAVSGSF